MATEAERLSDEPMAFFPHDADAANDMKCRKLIRRCGFEGYGRWWRLCELLASTSGHAIPVDTTEDLEILAEVLRFDSGCFGDEFIAAEECKSFIETLLEIGLLKRNKDMFVENSRMRKNALYYGQQRANGRKGGRPKKPTTSKTTGQTA